MARKGLDKIFVKRYWIGLKGTSDYDELISANSPSEAIKKYMWQRNLKRNDGTIIHKRWKK